jgi:hypothetical protein
MGGDSLALMPMGRDSGVIRARGRLGGRSPRCKPRNENMRMPECCSYIWTPFAWRTCDIHCVPRCIRQRHTTMGFGKRVLELFVPDPHKGIKDRKHLTTLSLACLIFFNVCGGPYGSEVCCLAQHAQLRRCPDNAVRTIQGHTHHATRANARISQSSILPCNRTQLGQLAPSTPS